MITPAELAQFRTESGLSQTNLADILNDILDMHYGPSQISNWEGGKKNIPAYVQETIEGLRGGTLLPDGAADSVPESEEVKQEEAARTRRPDSSPNVPPNAVVLPPVSDVIATGMETATIEMFRGIGQMVELFGAMFSPEKQVTLEDSHGNKTKVSLVELDGRTIEADAEILGKAWAKLATQNMWVAKVVNSLTVGGAWVDVLAATSGTLVKVYRNHADYSTWLAAQNGNLAESTAGDSPEPAQAN